MCEKCNKLLDIKEFSFYKNKGKNIRRTNCNNCRRLYQKIYMKNEKN